MNIYNLKFLIRYTINSDSSLTKNSIRTRLSSVNKILNDFNYLDDSSVITKNKILEHLKSIKYKSDLITCINTIKFLKEKNITLDFPSEDEMKEIIKLYSK